MFQLEKTVPETPPTEDLVEGAVSERILKKSFSWSEKNVSDWAKERLTQLLMQVAVVEEDSFCRVVRVNDINGEFTVYNRKGRRFCSYDLEVAAEFQGQVEAGQGMNSGEIYIPHIGEEYGEDEFEIQITGDDPLKTFVRETMDPMIREKVIVLLKELCEEYEIEKKFAVISKPLRINQKSKPKEAKKKRAPIDLQAKGYKTIGSKTQESAPKKNTPPPTKVTPSPPKEIEKKKTTTTTSKPKNEIQTKPIDWYSIGKYSIITVGVLSIIPLAYFTYKYLFTGSSNTKQEQTVYQAPRRLNPTKPESAEEALARLLK